MKLKNLFFAMTLLVVLGFAFTSCYASKDVRELDKTVSVSRKISYFSKVEIVSFADVKFVQGKSVSMRIEGSKDLVDGVEVEQKGETLVISQKSSKRLFGNGNKSFTIYLSSPDLVAVTLIGSGTFSVNGNLDTDALAAELKGSGDIFLNSVVCDKFDANLRGSGDINVMKVNTLSASVGLFGSGDVDVKNISAKSVDLSLKGSGDLDAKLANVSKTNLSVFGSGDMDVEFVDCGHAECLLRGSGDLDLKGTLKSINKTKTGSGDIDIDELNIIGSNL